MQYRRKVKVRKDPNKIGKGTKVHEPKPKEKHKHKKRELEELEQEDADTITDLFGDTDL
jgi:hypothetical protein